MRFDTEQVLVLILVFSWFVGMVVLRTIGNKAFRIIAAERRSRELAELARLFEKGRDWDKERVRRLFSSYHELRQAIILPAKEREEILRIADAPRIEKRMLRALHSRSRIARMEAASSLALIASDGARKALEARLPAERDHPVRLHIANALADIGDIRSIPCMVESLVGSHRWYRSKVNMLIASFGEGMADAVRGYFWRTDVEIRELLVDIAGTCVCEELRDYLVDLLDAALVRRAAGDQESCVGPSRCCAHCVNGLRELPDGDRYCTVKSKNMHPDEICPKFVLKVSSIDADSYFHRVLVKAAESLAKNYYASLDDPRFYENPDEEIAAVAIRSLGNHADEHHVEKLLELLHSEKTAPAAKQGLSRILSRHHRHLGIVTREFSLSFGASRRHIADVLGARMEYFTHQLAGHHADESSAIIRQVLAQGNVSEFVELLKRNRDIDLDNAMVDLVRGEIAHNETLRRECALYLDDRHLERCGIARMQVAPLPREIPKEPALTRTLWALLAFALLLFPSIYAVRHFGELAVVPFVQQLKTFIVDFNTQFAYYSMAVNLTYLLLVILSSIRVGASTRLWNLKTMTMLFKPEMLPSISIIAPAYNEEKTIIESSSSLLNLKYPDYELVIVNDGSRDGTLQKLIDHYGLERADYAYQKRLKHRQIRGIYTNPILPRLVVVDKENGGKADSLNAGINVSSREYFCGIDADSLLEPDALLKVASLTLDSGIETPAMGGNVFPINGCTVDHGKLESISLPENRVARLQTIEYLRAFMCGRLGWAQLNSLLIISGAFGLFRKERVISIGGYLTANERFKKDTVGEDMELVVRIARMMRERKLKYLIGYAYNANCWTEVPESLNVLHRQRDRWHRGLIDILYFHRKLLFNPGYGRMGMLGMPYFFIFELLGPLFEIQGYAMVGLAMFFGLMSNKLALLLFFSTILMGILISMSSILISERNTTYFNYRDSFRMLWMAFAENFGPRQVFSFWRVLGFFSAMKSTAGWGKMERKGFSRGAPPPGAASPGKADAAEKAAVPTATAGGAA